MRWIVLALSLAQVTQGLVPEVGGAQNGAGRSALKSFMQNSVVKKTTGSTMPTLNQQGIMHEDLPLAELGNPSRRLNVQRVREDKMRNRRDKNRDRDERRSRGGKTDSPSFTIGPSDTPTTPSTEPKEEPAKAKTTPVVTSRQSVNATPDPKPKEPSPAADPEPEPVVEELKKKPEVAEVTTPPPSSGGNSGGFTESGDLTYYGGAGENGACSQTFVPPGYTTVAINNDQWNGGANCGSCVEGCFTNEFDGGQRCFKAIIDNLCPECVKGDLDMGENNGGRWDVNWKFIDCPSSGLKVMTEGGNKWYAKVKVQGGPSSINSMTCKYSGKTVKGEFTDDGFFEFWDRTAETFTCNGMSCSVAFSRGGSGSVEISQADLGNKC